MWFHYWFVSPLVARGKRACAVWPQKMDSTVLTMKYSKAKHELVSNGLRRHRELVLGSRADVYPGSWCCFHGTWPPAAIARCSGARIYSNAKLYGCFTTKVRLHFSFPTLEQESTGTTPYLMSMEWLHLINQTYRLRLVEKIYLSNIYLSVEVIP